MTTRLRLQRYFWSTVVAGLGAIATSGLLLAQGQDAGAQGQPVTVLEPQILVAHGLAMAIEGSTLEALATRRGGAVVTPVVVAPGTVVPDTVPPRAIPPAAVSEFVVEPGAVAPAGDAPVPAAVAPAAPVAVTPAAPVAVKPAAPAAVAPAAVVPAGDAPAAVAPVAVAPAAVAPVAVAPAAVPPAGTTTAGAGGGAGTTSHEPYGSDAGPRRTGGLGPRTTEAIAAGVPNAVVPVAGSRAAADPGAMELHRHAMRAFDESDRLLKEASQAGSEGRAARFQVAAIQYAATLRLLSKQQNDRLGTTPVLVLNHAVKEALTAMELRQLVRAMGSADSPAGRALLSHARDMETRGLEAVEGVLSPRQTASGPAITGEPSGQGVPLRTLALQASEVVMALQSLTGELPPTGKEK